MVYSRDGDQLCSNFAIAFAFIGVILSIVPQSTCSVLSINPVEIITLPDDWPENFTEIIGNIVPDDQYEESDFILPDLFNSDSWFEFPRRNVTSNNFTANVGFWKIGSFKIDNVCYNMGDIAHVQTEDQSIHAGRALAILSSVLGFVGLVAGCFTCHVHDKVRKVRNRYIALVYFLSSTSAWTSLVIFSSDFCRGKEVEWDDGLLEGLALLYGGCVCRAGCFITIAVACCYMISALTVLIRTG